MLFSGIKPIRIYFHCDVVVFASHLSCSVRLINFAALQSTYCEYCESENLPARIYSVHSPFKLNPDKRKYQSSEGRLLGKKKLGNQSISLQSTINLTAASL